MSLLSFLGGSFHGDLTGRENVFLEGALLGQSRSELKAKLDAIFAFAELERFIDLPIKFFSAGVEITARAGERVALEVQFRPLPLARGSHALHVLIYEHRLAVEPVLVWKRDARFRVALPEKEGVGLVRIAHEWRVTPDGRREGR